MNRFWRLLLLITTATACVQTRIGVQPAPSLERERTGKSEREGRVQLNIPFFPRRAGLCGPASLASVLNFWGYEITPEEIAAEIYLPKIRGTLHFDLSLFARTKGFSAAAYRGSLEDLKDRISKGIPLIAFLNIGNAFIKSGHFLVVTGFAPGRNAVIVHSGQTGDLTMPLKRFMAAWEGGAYWTLEITPLVNASH